VCHQTVGLIARQLEAAGIATVSLSSARDITAAVGPPRAVFVDFPLGHTAGRVGDPALGRAIVAAAFDRLTVTEPRSIVDLPHRWADTDDWKDAVMRPAAPADPTDPAGSAAAAMVDDRVERHPTPQYQSPADETAAAATHPDPACPVCRGVDY
jgi:hypothetical protein